LTINSYIVLYPDLFENLYIYLFMVLGFELRASSFMVRHSTTWAIPLALTNFFAHAGLNLGSPSSISASWVVGVTGKNHCTQPRKSYFWWTHFPICNLLDYFNVYRVFSEPHKKRIMHCFPKLSLCNRYHFFEVVLQKSYKDCSLIYQQF
jgi:hypothetical protein